MKNPPIFFHTHNHHNGKQINKICETTKDTNNKILEVKT